MFFKKFKNKIFGVEFTQAEKQIIEDELDKERNEYLEKTNDDLACLILYVLHHYFKWGPVRLKRFHDVFDVELDKLTKHYEMKDSDGVWLAKEMLKKDGIDVDEWK